MSLAYRLLGPDEWHLLDEVVPEEYLPDPRAASAAVATDEEGRIVGVLFLQVALHMEPLVLQHPKVSFKNLFYVLYNAVAERKGLRFYAFAHDDVVAGMCEHVEMTEQPYRVYEGRVE